MKTVIKIQYWYQIGPIATHVSFIGTKKARRYIFEGLFAAAKTAQVATTHRGRWQVR